MLQTASKKCSKSSEAEEYSNGGLLHCAHLVLPWLTSLELANISLSCKSLNAASKSITLRRILDASRSIEPLPIPFHSSIDNHPYAFFLYAPAAIVPNLHSDRRQPWGSISDPGPDHLQTESASLVLASGCHCENCADSEFECPCSSLDGLEDVASECGPRCSCGLECQNRPTQRGISVRLKILRDEKKGWGLYADELIQEGSFVCEYAGELLTTGEARRRQKLYDARALGGRFASSLLVVREHLPSGNACLRINIDATQIGNVARFINHSCDGGNLATRLVRSAGVMLPRLCFYASRMITKDEELTFSYGDIRLKPEGLKCFCGSSCCLGILPSENT
ncbi:histone-lysine N-methyltransferase SUVR3 isoform X2 [Momordica charantia]|uniref:Histone-lysine N-methyltransferase SUVR3 isoform X2 n=1 Tax=Momordica charantia TaxID=3673 RepID=A0A6J1D3D2_MOMCH|nr:histone-lysine N-methyltransferase SUVR3 isoform X2 [Momordica charantia]